MNKGAINSDLPIYDDENRAWDSGAAIKRVKDWASDSDGNIDFGKYRKAFFWFEGGNKRGDFKLPYADVIEGNLKAVWRGVAAAMGALLGARGGVQIPDEDRKSVYNAIAKYYKKFNKDAPEFKALGGEELEEEEEESPVEPVQPTTEPEAPPPPEEPANPAEQPSNETLPRELAEADKRYVKAYYDPKQKLAVASTDLEDRHGERIDQTGWDLKNFKKNNVMLWAHDHLEISVGNAQNIHISKADGKPKLVFTPDFHTVTEKARALKTLYDEGRLNSFSVGFLPTEMDGNTYTKQELLEISACNVPANPDAMMLAYKSLKDKGFKQKTIKELGIPVEVLDKLDTMQKDISELSQKVDSLVKAKEAQPAPAAPQTRSQTKTQQSLVKVVAKASDKILAGEKSGQAQEERVQYVKIIKRAAEILSKAQKEQLK